MRDIAMSAAGLLAGQPSPFESANPAGRSDILLVCEHAGRQMPPSLDWLGLAQEHRNSHIVSDIGARELSIELSRRLDAALVMQRYSRLVYDSNRDWGATDETPSSVDFIEVPGNRDLTEGQRRSRRDEVYGPFRDGTRKVIDQRIREGRRTAIVTIHSFTPVFKGRVRHLDVGIVHDTDTRLADLMLGDHRPARGLDIERNEPYGPDRGVTHTLKVHGIARGLLNVMVEIRNDHLMEAAGLAFFADLMADWISTSVDKAFLLHEQGLPYVSGAAR